MTRPVRKSHPPPICFWPVRVVLCLPPTRTLEQRVVAVETDLGPRDADVLVTREDVAAGEDHHVLLDAVLRLRV